MTTFAILPQFKMEGYVSRQAEMNTGLDVLAEYREKGNLTECSLPRMKESFGKGFRGDTKTYRFDSGIIITREVVGASCKLYEPRFCLAKLSFKVSRLYEWCGAEGERWEVFKARNTKNNLIVRSIIKDVETGSSWSNGEEWFWKAFFNFLDKPYIAVTEIRDASHQGDLY